MPRPILATALAKLLPSGDAGLDGAHVAIAAVSGAGNRADDAVIDDKRKPPGMNTTSP
jgi:hypothetical protein